MITMSEREEENWNGYIDGFAPVQGCGFVDGYPWYFRARGDRWRMEIAKDKSIDCESLPSVGWRYSGWIVREGWGKWPEAGHMDEETAWSLIKNAIKNFRANKLGFVYVEEKEYSN